MVRGRSISLTPLVLGTLLCVTVTSCRNDVGGPGNTGEGEGEGAEGEGEGEGECEGPPVVGMRVLVEDNSTGFPVCDANVRATEGAETFEFATGTFNNNGDCLYTGLDDNPGTYTLIVTRLEYTDFSASNRVVEPDGCHVQTLDVTVPFNPL